MKVKMSENVIKLEQRKGKSSLVNRPQGGCYSKDEVKTSSLQNILRPEVESDISRSTTFLGGP